MKYIHESVWKGNIFKFTEDGSTDENNIRFVWRAARKSLKKEFLLSTHLGRKNFVRFESFLINSKFA